MRHIFMQISSKPTVPLGKREASGNLKNGIQFDLAQKAFSFLSIRTKLQMEKEMAFLKIDCRSGWRG